MVRFFSNVMFGVQHTNQLENRMLVIFDAELLL